LPDLPVLVRYVVATRPVSRPEQGAGISAAVRAGPRDPRSTRATRR
jgi:hypothetical protein